MPAFYRRSVPEFVTASESELAGVLAVAHAGQGFESLLSEATLTWMRDIQRLQGVLIEVMASKPFCKGWTILLEFVIPRKEKRIDVVLLTPDAIVLLEQKSGRTSNEDVQQLDEYALLLHYFHQPSHRRKIFSFLVSTSLPTDPDSRQQELELTDTPRYWIHPVCRISWVGLADRLADLCEPACGSSVIDPVAWDLGEYFPVPSIIEAARNLQAGLGIREIAHSRASQHDIQTLTQSIQQYVARARERKEFLICFVTGVPGSGKTLVGLNLAFSSRADGDTLNFMSGNGPLVSVLQALFKDYRQKVEGVPASQAKIDAGTLIEDVHLFAKTYTSTTPNAVPSNHVVIFDEAQRAWDFEQSRRKFGRDSSEPEMFLKIMERHQDWAVILALVGGGQEINDGEAGLEEWGRALSRTKRPWRIVASPDVISGGDSVAGGSLVPKAEAQQLTVEEDRNLHLTISLRSLKAENYSRWVNAVVDGDASRARALNTGEFPVFITRSLDTLRRSLRNQRVGHSRIGLVGSSKAARLRAEGLEPDGTFHGEYRWDRWYLAPTTDVRSSSQLEVFATEFEIQGLELDWIGLCWGGDFVWSAKQQRWLTRKFRNADSSGWSNLKQESQQRFRRNSYRVLLTRARQGLILYVPLGDGADVTRDPAEFNETAGFLEACGARTIDSDVLRTVETAKEDGVAMLF